MKKRIISIALVLAVVLCGMCVPTSAAAEINVSAYFENYVAGTNQTAWDETTNPTGGFLPKFTGLGISATKFKPSFSATSGVAPVQLADSSYGTSMKMYQAYDASSGDYTYTYFDVSPNFSGSIYMESSMYIVENENGYAGVSMRFNPSGYPIAMAGSGEFTVFGANTGVNWEPDTWYDTKVWLNTETGAYQVQVYDGANKIVDKIGITGNTGALTRVIFWTGLPKKNAAMQTVGEQTAYFDNFKLESIYKFSIDESAALDYFDFEDWDNALGLPDTLSKGTWKKGLGGAGTHPVTQVTTDRGKSMKISSNTSDNVSSLSGGAKNDVTNPAVFFNYGKNITTAAGLKMSIMFPDNNFDNFQMKMANGIIALQALSDASITTFDGVDTGMDVKLDTWYDLAIVLDYDTGYYTLSLTNEDGECFERNGFSKETIALTDTRIYRTWLRLNGQWDGEYSEPTSVIIDDFYYGAVSKLNAPLYGGYDFADNKVPELFTVTGGTATASSGVMSISGTPAAETVVAMDLPFKNTKFRYLAAVTLSDLNADRTLVATTADASAEVVKLGTDGKLYIGGTEVADASVTTGTYSVEATFDQAGYTATVKVSKNGTVIGTGTAALGAAKVLLTSVDWKIGNAQSTTALDDIDFRGIYNFLLDNNASTTGAEKEIKLSDAVVAKFTNALDRSTFNSSTVSVNSGAVTPEISFPDDNTVKFDFEKFPGEKYRIDMTGVKDLFGNSVTDYIQFSVEEDDNLYLTEVEFTQNGEIAEKTAPGTITASFDAAAYNEDVDVFFAIAAYESGKLADCDFDIFTISDTIENHDLSLTIPDDGKHYILKAFIWDSATLKPYADVKILEATTLPVVILKLDGVGVAGRYEAFEPCYEYAAQNDIKMNFGVIARDLASTAYPEQIAKLDEMENHEMIEFWNHQYGAGNMGDWTPEEVMQDFENAKRVSESSGVEYVTFNSIENYIHQKVVDALNAYNYKAVLSRMAENELANKGYFDEGNTFRVLWRTFDVEGGVSGTLEDGTTATGKTVCLPVEDLVDDWENSKFLDWPYAMLQYHPVNWPASDLTTADGKVYSSDYMYDFIEYMEAEGAIFMTTTEYLDYSSVLHPVR